MKKPKNIPTLKKELLILISRYVKLKYADETGRTKCFTCGTPIKINTSFCQAGHCFSKSGYPALQFNLDNIRCQCDSCNITLNGNEAEFKKRLMLDIGQEKYAWLESHKNDTVKLDREKMSEQIATYKLLIDDMSN